MPLMLVLHVTIVAPSDRCGYDFDDILACSRCMTSITLFSLPNTDNTKYSGTGNPYEEWRRNYLYLSQQWQCPWVALCAFSCEAISIMSSTRRQRVVMATDSEWERIGKAKLAAGMEISRFIVQRILMPDSLLPEVMRRAVGEMLSCSVLRSGASEKLVLVNLESRL